MSANNIDTIRFKYEFGKNLNLPMQRYATSIAWPVFAYQCIAHEPINTKFDAIEMAILRFAIIGYSSPGRVSEYLGLDEQLIKHIQNNFKEKGFIKPDGLASDRALAFFEDDSKQYFSVNKISGWIFVSALSGHIMPMFYSGKLPAYRQRASKDIFLMDNGSGREVKATLSSQAIYDAMKRYSRIYNASNSYGFLNEDREDQDDEFIDIHYTEFGKNQTEKTGNVSLGDIDVYSEKPVKFYIETAAYILPDNQSEIIVEPPFDIPYTSWFSKNLRDASKLNSDTADVFELLMMDASEIYKINFDIENYTAFRTQNFPYLKKGQYFKRIDNHLEKIYNALQLFEKDIMYYDALVIRYYKCMEAVLNICWELIDDRNELAKKIGGTLEFNSKITTAAEKKGVFLPQNLKSPKYAQFIKNTARYGGQSVQEKCVFLLFDAFFNGDKNPFAKALQENNMLLEDAVQLSTIRNKCAAHDNESEQDRSDIEIREITDKMIKGATQFVNLICKYITREDKIDAKEK